MPRLSKEEIKTFAATRVEAHIAALAGHYFDDDGCPQWPAEPLDDDEEAFRELPGNRTEDELDQFWAYFNDVAVERACELAKGWTFKPLPETTDENPEF